MVLHGAHISFHTGLTHARHRLYFGQPLVTMGVFFFLASMRDFSILTMIPLLQVLRLSVCV